MTLKRNVVGQTYISLVMFPSSGVLLPGILRTGESSRKRMLSQVMSQIYPTKSPFVPSVRGASPVDPPMYASRHMLRWNHRRQLFQRREYLYIPLTWSELKERFQRWVERAEQRIVNVRLLDRKAIKALRQQSMELHSQKQQHQNYDEQGIATTPSTRSGMSIPPNQQDQQPRTQSWRRLTYNSLQRQRRRQWSCLPHVRRSDYRFPHLRQLRGRRFCPNSDVRGNTCYLLP
jgi:hypothetical protein